MPDRLDKCAVPSNGAPQAHAACEQLPSRDAARRRAQGTQKSTSGAVATSSTDAPSLEGPGHGMRDLSQPCPSTLAAPPPGDLSKAALRRGDAAPQLAAQPLAPRAGGLRRISWAHLQDHVGLPPMGGWGDAHANSASFVQPSTSHGKVGLRALRSCGVYAWDCGWLQGRCVIKAHDLCVQTSAGRASAQLWVCMSACMCVW